LLSQRSKGSPKIPLKICSRRGGARRRDGKENKKKLQGGMMNQSKKRGDKVNNRRGGLGVLRQQEKRRASTNRRWKDKTNHTYGLQSEGSFKGRRGCGPFQGEKALTSSEGKGKKQKVVERKNKLGGVILPAKQGDIKSLWKRGKTYCRKDNREIEKGRGEKNKKTAKSEGRASEHLKKR